MAPVVLVALSTDSTFPRNLNLGNFRKERFDQIPQEKIDIYDEPWYSKS